LPKWRIPYRVRRSTVRAPAAPSLVPLRVHGGPLMQSAQANDYPNIPGLATRLEAWSAHAHARRTYAPFSYDQDVRPREADGCRRPFEPLSRFATNCRTAWRTSRLTFRELCACAYRCQSGIRRTHPAATGT